MTKLHPILTLILCLFSVSLVHALRHAADEDFSANDYLMAANIHSDMDAKWYDQSFQEILNSKIITSTRNESSVNEVPGVVTVYTSQTIQRMGLRSVKELLERTTGFFINRQLTGATIGSRGIIADTDQFLLLVDGHSLNSIIDRGMGESFLFPNLAYVDRVEIIRGPGSTLWGSDASLGVIHIITKDGAAIDGLRVSANHSDDGTSHVNLQAGEEIAKDIDIMASLTVAQSDGFEIVGAGGQPFNLYWDEMKESYELYSKARLRNFTIKARAFQSNISRPYHIFQSPDEPAYSQRSHYYVDIAHNKNIFENFNLETRVFSGALERVQASVTPQLSPNATTGKADQSSQEDVLGLEMIGRWQVLNSHQLLLGFKKVRTNISPVIEQVSFPIETSAGDMTGTVSHLVIPAEVDDNTSIFFEDNWQVIPNTLSIIGGIRFDKNNLREDNTIALPRFAVNWHVSPSLQIKYSYNTGYIRPSAGIGFLGQEQYFEYIDDRDFWNSVSYRAKRVGIKKSQEIASHDVQFIYTHDSFRGNINFYYTEVDNPFQILYEPDDVDATTRVAYYANTNTITASGTELELAYQFSKALDIYASFAYVFDASIESMVGSADGIDYDLNNTVENFGEFTYDEDGTMSAYPHITAHLGGNWVVYSNIVGNLHLRYWDDMGVRDGFDHNTTVNLGPEYYIDVNMRFAQILGSSLDASVYVKNLLNNDDSETTMMLFGNTWREQGRRIGMSLVYLF